MAVKAQEFEQVIRAVGQSAREVSQALTPAHLFVHSLENIQKSSPLEETGNALRRIRLEIIPRTVLHERSPTSIDATFDHDAAWRELQQFIEDRKFPGELEEALAWWLLDGSFDDKYGLAGDCRSICRQCRVTAAITIRRQGAISLPELGFGRSIEAFAAQEDELIGRGDELRKHLGLLRIALNHNRHYLLVGQRGVGKSLFLRRLLPMADAQFRNDRRHAGRAFVWFDQGDFLGAAAHVKDRLERLHEYLQAYPGLIPVFDSLEYLLNGALAIHEHFVSIFGGELFAGGRTFVLACHTDAARGSDLLRNVRGQTLPALPREHAAAVARRELTRQQERFGVDLKYEVSLEAFADRLVVQASERYPDRCFPEIAIHLAGSVVNRAANRVLSLHEQPLDCLTSQDLWEHVAEEQSINLEVLGKDPQRFYANLKESLKRRVIGQDHAVDWVCDALDDQRRDPSRDIPRGRFLFVGPPGVGKTHLARALAEDLGYDQEAFFILNMSEFSTDGARTRFVGSDPGYVGFGQTRTLYDVASARPSCVILLDEVDRAHPSIQDILLSILEGRGNDASGRTVRFSQAIFMMTTNQGQNQVEAAYHTSYQAFVPELKAIQENHGDSPEETTRKRELRKGMLDAFRKQMADAFDDDQLRRLLLEGVLDQSELNMRQVITERIEQARGAFEKRTGGDLDAIHQYLTLRELHQALELRSRQVMLDRAFLDRIDFIIPFFPIREPDLVRRIVDFKAHQLGWPDCPDDARQFIVSSVLTPGGSVRMIERLLKKLRVKSRRRTP